MIIIPAYQPTPILVKTVTKLLTLYKSSGVLSPSIVVVDDGSSTAEAKNIFSLLESTRNITILHHGHNMGKGAAIKTGIEYAIKHKKLFVVTADADGQHDPKDIFRVFNTTKEKNAFVLGVRTFDQKIPLRSQLGNTLTKKLFNYIFCTEILDTQTGLRGIPHRFFLPLIKISCQKYEFEFEALIHVIKSEKIYQISIKTIYEPGNPLSHFRPIQDSGRIYFVFLRHIFSIFLIAFIDLTIFSGLVSLGMGTFQSIGAARLCAFIIYFFVARNFVFQSKGYWIGEGLKFTVLVLINALLVWQFVDYAHSHFNTSKITTYLFGNFTFFIANFVIQRAFIFRSNGETNWDKYYDKPFCLASYTRKISANKIHKIISQNIHSKIKKICELGGGNSCFLTSFLEKFELTTYHVIDFNKLGLSLLTKKHGGNRIVTTEQTDIIKMDNKNNHFDFVYSVGLVEHFHATDRIKAISSHFDLCKEGGYVLLTFPTPTILYQIIRKTAEIFGLWHFPDEHPLKIGEVERYCFDHGKIVHKSTNWLIGLTQGYILTRKY